MSTTGIHSDPKHEDSSSEQTIALSDGSTAQIITKKFDDLTEEEKAEVIAQRFQSGLSRILTEIQEGEEIFVDRKRGLVKVSFGVIQFPIDQIPPEAKIIDSDLLEW